MSGALLPRVSRWSLVVGLIGLLPFLKTSSLLIVLPVLMLQVAVLPDRPAPFELFTAVITLTALPLAAASAFFPGRLAVLLLLLPGLPWLDSALRRCALWTGRPVVAVPLPGGRGVTPLLLAMSTGLVAQAGVGVLAGQTLLVGVAMALLGFVAAEAGWAYRRIPGGGFLSSRRPSVRVLAGEPLAARVALTSRAPQMLQVWLEAVSNWAAVIPATFALTPAGEVAIDLRATPPLAGPGTVSAVATALDPRGLIAARQEIDLAEARVIPRARYAAWLAREYLEHSRSGAVPAGMAAELAHPRATRGLDYYGARAYEPGDAFRDVFWKPTLKLGKIVVKDRREGRGEPVIVVVDLTAPDAQEEDRLAYALLMVALTLARDGVPVAFAAYAAGAVASVTPPLAPQAAVRAALDLVERVRLAPRPRWVLQPPEMIRLRRLATRLLGARNGAAGRLARLLVLEHEALGRRTLAHPGAAALRRACALVSPPAGVWPLVPVADRAILDIALLPLEDRGFRCIPSRTSSSAR